jgi:hypothetical protein
MDAAVLFYALSNRNQQTEWWYQPTSNKTSLVVLTGVTIHLITDSTYLLSKQFSLFHDNA